VLVTAIGEILLSRRVCDDHASLPATSWVAPQAALLPMRKIGAKMTIGDIARGRRR
jgi:hypothetical protein